MRHPRARAAQKAACQYGCEMPPKGRKTVTDPVVHIYLDESNTHASSPRVLVGAVATMENEHLVKLIRDTQNELLAMPHPWQQDPDKRSRFAQVGPHYTEDLPSVQDAFVSLLPRLSFRAHLIHSARGLALSDREIQAVGFHLLLLNTARRYRAFPINYIFEEDSAKNRLYGRLLNNVINLTGHPRISGYITGKPNAGISVVDYVMGVAADHLDTTKPQFRRSRYDSVVPHVAHLMDLDTAAHISRQKGKLFL